MAKFCLRCVQLIHKHNQYLTGIQIGFGTKIGKALMFPHYSCIVINGSAIIGDNCTIYHGVTVGSVRGPKGGAPHIGNNVVIASGAKVIGNITIGNNVMIGSGAIVVTDIPDNSVVVGNPGKVISKRGLEHTKYFRNSGKLLFVPYTKDFGRITQFWGNDLATVLYATFCSDMLSSHSFSKQR